MSQCSVGISEITGEETIRIIKQSAQESRVFNLMVAVDDSFYPSVLLSSLDATPWYT